MEEGFQLVDFSPLTKGVDGGAISNVIWFKESPS